MTIPADSPVSVPVAAQLNTANKTIDLDLTNAKLKPGTWKLAANWDWEPITVAGTLVLHDFSAFKSAHLTPESQDELTAGAGTLDLQLTGDDFEFVHKIDFEKQGDPFGRTPVFAISFTQGTARRPGSVIESSSRCQAARNGQLHFPDRTDRRKIASGALQSAPRAAFTHRYSCCVEHRR